MNIIKYPERAEWVNLLKRSALKTESLRDTVMEVLDKVRAEGDRAVIEFEEKFDKVNLSSLAVTEEEFDEADKAIGIELKAAIMLALNNIKKFHSAQKFEGKKVETMPGVTCWQKAVAIEKVGLYVPGGTAPLFSTVLMLATPAKIAGCKEIVLCSPPNREGKIHPAILYAARAAGVSKVFKAGGVQAIGAMAYGTESIPKVYKIFGPGNQFVTTAKQQVSLRDVAIDMPAGPSEVAVLADETANPIFVASDLLSQAEHGADSQAILITTSEKLLEETALEVEKQLAALPRKELASKSLESSKLILVNDMDEAVTMVNEYAPEHLIIETKDYAEIAERIVNAGSVFLGQFSPESAGDYASGTNHTLPTNGYAKAYSGVSLDSFIRKITFQEISGEGISTIGPAIQVMAASEYLDGHKNAITVRLASLNK
ncbi:histidinol dehydrogenase [uncultured Bacteroides sp.]|uniref:histidinol dehydrogenase n=1 Tax=uncultured Bacteroides sp. TaxID=162156 RepID=UPI0026100C71|nr:histidinol dehydrogenase [uncultured Bacteroides sp.]